MERNDDDTIEYINFLASKNMIKQSNKENYHSILV